MAEDTGIGGVGWSPDGAYVLFNVGGGVIRHEQTPTYSGSKIIYTITENVPGKPMAISAAGGAAKEMAASGFGARRWLDARHFIPSARRPTSSGARRRSSTSKPAPQRCCTKTSRRSSTASPATRAQTPSRHLTRNG